MIQSYMEETEDMLQKGEECLIRLEKEYSSVDVNELFRIAHTIKGSSHMVGYEEVGNLMHKIEDMLDCARNESIQFDQSIVSLCFEGLDTVKRMVHYKREHDSDKLREDLLISASRLEESIEVFIGTNKKVKEKPVIVEPELGIISSHLVKKPNGRNKYYITFFFEEDAPMISPIIMMILNCVSDIGVLIYSSVDDNYFEDTSGDNDIKTYEIVISTNIDEAELYTYFALFYIERINIVDLSRSKVENKDYSFIDGEDSLHLVILRAFIKLNKIIFNLNKEFKIDKDEIDIMIILHNQAVNAFERMKNKNPIINFIKDFNGLYSRIIDIYEDNLIVDEKLCQHIQMQVYKIMKKEHDNSKGKRIVNIYTSEVDSFVTRLKNFIDMFNRSNTAILLIDVSRLTSMSREEIIYLIEVKRQLEAQNIEIGIISEEPNGRRIFNILDSITEIEEFHVFVSELQAILYIFNSDDFFERISNRVKDVEYV